MMLPYTSALLTSLLLLFSMGFFTLLEQKLLGYIQLRKGPNKSSFVGGLQPATDGLKLFTKESTSLSTGNTTTFSGAALLSITLAIMLWILYPSPNPATLVVFSSLFFLCLSSITVYPTMLAGWASNAKYSLLGTLRSVAQTISYEVSMALTLISTLILTLIINFPLLTTTLKMNLFLLAPLLSLIWFTTTLAETNRSPFDFAEGESELVSGFNTEYGGPEFALIFMAEYLNIIFISMVTALIFTQGSPLWPYVLSIKMIMVSTIFILTRGTMPRLRYDRLMIITWTSFLPASLITILLFTCIS